jgi:septal ring factor EnvC (AmiA/AmiB activator)
MTETIVASIIAGLIQIFAVLTAFYVGVRKMPVENRKMTAEEKSIQAETIDKQGKTLANAFDEIKELRDNLKIAQDKISELERDLRKWRNFSARLQKQIVEEFKGVPVPFDTNPPQTKKEAHE